jgi:hypothetical protein
LPGKNNLGPLGPAAKAEVSGELGRVFNAPPSIIPRSLLVICLVTRVYDLGCILSVLSIVLNLFGFIVDLRAGSAKAGDPGDSSMREPAVIWAERER